MDGVGELRGRRENIFLEQYLLAQSLAFELCEEVAEALRRPAAVLHRLGVV